MELDTCIESPIVVMVWTRAQENDGMHHFRNSNIECDTPERKKKQHYT